MTPEQRVMRARIAAHAQHAQGRTNTAAARKAFADRWEREVDPDGVLAPVERAKRAEHAKRAHFQRLALKSAQSRARKTRNAA
ncbi:MULTISPECIES: hypothetical protein [Prauserella salsuginis group]|uniref:Uncharacterized protein n=2 Tax=Prauserella salsuginis group TaxID=2893672 RepID=A0A839XYF0_9PSEU|nr:MULTISPECIES: hypothetical protein [Prauserella salsuginis group]MBB3666384.1 hypothetical protein [Prauserella sediminis]MCR3719173.1 hypothetical protein [Prauserella flava]MCR3735814.1 hypothetical protein [Prauserella salsuginis]